MPEEMHVRVGVAAVLWRPSIVALRPDRRQVLMGRRRGSHGAGTWAFPGGKPDLYESIVATAARELVEEALWRPSDGEPRVMEPEKCEEWRWFDEAPSPLFLPVRWKPSKRCWGRRC